MCVNLCRVGRNKWAILLLLFNKKRKMVELFYIYAKKNSVLILSKLMTLFGRLAFFYNMIQASHITIYFCFILKSLGKNFSKDEDRTSASQIITENESKNDSIYINKFRYQ